MNVSRVLSLLVFVLVVAALRWLAPAGVWNERPGLVVSAMIAAAAAALVHWCLCRIFVDRALCRLHRQVAGLTGPAGSARTGWLGWPEGLARAIDRTGRAMRQRIEELELRARESEAQAQSAMAAAQTLETVLRSISDGVIVTDGSDRVVLANDAAARALGLGVRDVRHQPIERVLDDTALVRAIRQTRLSGDTQDVRRFEHTVGGNGSARAYEVGLACTGEAGRGACGVAMVLRDVTRQARLAAVQNDLVCGLSHELRTPASSIAAYAEMLLDGEARDEESRREFYTIIQSEALRLSRLIENVLNISRIESGMLQVQRERVGLAAIVHEAVEVMRPQAAEKSIELHDRPGAPGCSVYADRDMILQAVLNLVSNAIKYTPEGGSVTVEAAADEAGGTASIHVTDTGVGLPPEEMPRLFGKFYRVREHRKMAPGTGLGLNLVKQIVETVHHGVVTARSVVGRGSVFSITLPLAGPEAGPDAGAQNNSLAPLGEPRS